MKAYDVSAGYDKILGMKTGRPGERNSLDPATKLQIRSWLVHVAERVNNEVLSVYSGRIIPGLDGSGFGEAAHPGEFLGCIVVETTPEGARAIEALSCITAVEEQPEFATGCLDQPPRNPPEPRP